MFKMFIIRCLRRILRLYFRKSCQFVCKKVNVAILSSAKFQKQNRQQKRQPVCQPRIFRTLRDSNRLDFGGAIKKSNQFIDLSFAWAASADSWTHETTWLESSCSMPWIYNLPIITEIFILFANVTWWRGLIFNWHQLITFQWMQSVASLQDFWCWPKTRRAVCLSRWSSSSKLSTTGTMASSMLAFDNRIFNDLYY